MALKDTLKEKIPQAQRGGDELDQYLDAVGELLDNFQLAIDDFKYHSDPKKIPEDELDDLAGQFDIAYPRNLSTTRKRELIQDAIDVYRSNGTERSLRRIFRLIGWEVTLDYCWTLNPGVSGDVQYVYNGSITYDGSLGYTYNNNPVVSPVGIYSVIFGNEKIYSNGVYADLYDAGGATYPKNTILGEQYDENSETDLLVVAKVPYVRINVNEEDYALFTQDYIDPDTGKVYSYSETEQFEITQQVINYFLEQTRPANVAILEIVTPFALSDTFVDSLDDSNIEFDYQGLTPEYDGTLSYGIASDRYILGENFDDFEYGTSSITYVESPSSQVISRSYPVGSSGTQNYIPLWKNAQFDLTVPSDAVVTLYTSESDRISLAGGTATWKVQGIYSNVTNEIINISDKFAARIIITNPSETTTIDTQITLSH